MDAVQFAEGHKQQVMIAKGDGLGKSSAIVASGFNAANFPHCGERPFGFDYQADQLDEAATALHHLRLLDPAQHRFQRIGSVQKGGSCHAPQDWLATARLVSGRASIFPKWGRTSHPPAW